MPLSTQVYKWVLANLLLGSNLRWTSIPSRGSSNTLSRLMLQKLGLSAGAMGQLDYQGTNRTVPLSSISSIVLDGRVLIKNQWGNGLLRLISTPGMLRKFFSSLSFSALKNPWKTSWGNPLKIALIPKEIRQKLANPSRIPLEVF